MQPIFAVAQTGTSDVNPGAMSRFTSRTYFSVNGDQYSQRTPAFKVKPGVTRQSSLMYASVVDARRYLSALPKATELVSGMPAKKSARSDPLASPVKVNVPRGSCCVSKLNCCRRKSPPKLILCRERDHRLSTLTVPVCGRKCEAMPSVRLVIPLAKLSVGGPQFRGSWLFPSIFALNDTSSRLAKNGTTWPRYRLNPSPKVVKNRGVKVCRKVRLPLSAKYRLVSRNPKRFGLSDRLLCSANCAARKFLRPMVLLYRVCRLSVWVFPPSSVW